MTVTRTDVSSTRSVGDMNEIQQLYQQSKFSTQKEAAKVLNMKARTFGAYVRGERIPDYKAMDRMRRVLGGDGKSVALKVPEHVRRIKLQSAGAGPENSKNEEIMVDERLFQGSGVGFDDHIFIRVQGSSMSAILSHGQIVFAEPCDEVVGQDIYVYWCGDEGGNVVAIMNRTPRGLRIEKRGPTREVTYWTHKEENWYESESGHTTKIMVQARVLGSFSRPADELAARNEAAVSAATALRK